MTLQNGLIHKGRAYLWTDTALWEAATGKAIGEVSKAFTGTQWPWGAVLSGTMRTDDPYRVQKAIGDAWPANPAELIEVTRDALRREALQGLMGRVLLAYPCPEYGARMFLIASDELPFAKPFEPFETVEYMCFGNGEPWAAEFAGKDLTPSMMRRFIDRQIENPSQTVLGWQGRTIGGNVVELKVTAEGVDSRVLRPIPEGQEQGDRLLWPA